MNDVTWLSEKKLVVWGVGKLGHEFAAIALEMSIPVSYYVDTFFSGDVFCINDTAFPVYKPEKLLDEERDSIHILLAVRESDAIAAQLNIWGFYEHTNFRAWKGMHLYIKDALHRLRHATADHDRPELFRQVEIETVNRCNHDCPFCPGNKHLDTRPFKVMDEALYESILRKLKDIEYRGSIILIGIGEELLDPYIALRVKIMHDILPDCRHRLMTNGLLLTLDLFIELIQHLDDLIINNYADDKQLLPNIQEISEYIDKHPELKSKVTIDRRLKNEVLATRGGTSPNKKIAAALAISCGGPFEFLTVRVDGRVSLCCCDYLTHYDMGDLNKQDIYDIWNGDDFRSIRKTLMEQGRPQLEMCKVCDVFSMLLQ